MDNFTAIEQGRARRDTGLALAISGRMARLIIARFKAMDAAMTRPERTATSDDAALAGLGNATGAIFKTPAWEFTGQWKPSNRPSNHARYIRVWRLREEF